MARGGMMIQSGIRTTHCERCGRFGIKA